MVQRVDLTHHPEKIGLFLGSIVSAIPVGGLNRNSPGDYTRDTKLNGDNHFGSPQMARLHLLQKAWPMIEREAQVLNAKRISESLEPIDISNYKSRLDHLYEEYTKKIEHIHRLKGIDLSDVDPLIDLSVRKDFIVSPNKLTSKLIKMLAQKDSGAILSSFRGNLTAEIASVELKQLSYEFEAAIKALREYNLVKYNPEKFDRVYQSYRQKSEALKQYIEKKIGPKHATPEDEDRNILKEASLVISAINTLYDKSCEFFYKSVNPIPGLPQAVVEYDHALQNFYKELKQGRSHDYRKVDERVEQAHQTILVLLTEAEKLSADESYLKPILQEMKERHIQDILYIDGKLNAQHIRRESDLPEEAFDHPKLWDHLETKEDNTDINALFNELKASFPAIDTLGDQLGQAFTNTPDQSIQFMLDFIPLKPERSKRNINVTFDDTGKPTVDVEIDYDFLWDPILKTIKYADKEGVLQTIDLKEEGSPYQHASEVLLPEVRKILEKKGERTPIAKLRYSVELDAPLLDHMKVTKLKDFSLEVAEGVPIKDEIPDMIYKDKTFTELYEKGLSLRSLCESADIPLPSRELEIDKDRIVQLAEIEAKKRTPVVDDPVLIEQEIHQEDTSSAIINEQQDQPVQTPSSMTKEKLAEARHKAAKIIDTEKTDVRGSVVEADPTKLTF